jgi:nucleolar MIF4G domain-containing protein 1
VLKPVDFVSLKPQTIKFMHGLLERIMFDSQTPHVPVLSGRVRDLPPKRDRDALELIMLKATRVPSLAAGLVFLLTSMSKVYEGPEMGDDESEYYSWACGIAIDTLRMGTDVVTSL